MGEAEKTQAEVWSHEELLSELEQCREDERNSLNQILQTIGAGATVLGLIFGASFLSSARDRAVPEAQVTAEAAGNSFSLFLLSGLVFFVMLFYILSIGIQNVLRYHYIQHIEDSLARLNPDWERNKYVSWMSFRSPITTVNPKHLRNRYAWLHYLCYGLSIVAGLFFCFILLWFQYRTCQGVWARIVLAIMIVTLVLTLVVYVYTCVAAKEMSGFAQKKSLERKQSRVNGSASACGEPEMGAGEPVGSGAGEEGRDMKEREETVFSVFLYFLYPKRNGLQKPVLALLGFLTGAAWWGSMPWGNLLLALLVVEYLAYQARYQINDIRGLPEDQAAGKRDRLPIKLLGKTRAVKLSLGIALLRMAAALAVAWFCGGALRNLLLAALAVLGVSTVAYEFSRKRSEEASTEASGKFWDSAVFLLVGTGYALRFAVGLLAVFPEAWFNVLQNPIAVPLGWRAWFLLAAFYLMGVFSVALAWEQEAIGQHRKGIGTIKAIYRRLYQRLQDSSHGGDPFPLRGKGYRCYIWNGAYILSMLPLSVVAWREGLPGLWLLELALMGLALALHYSTGRGIWVCSGLSLLLILGKLVYGVICQAWFSVCICVIQGLFVMNCAMLRYVFQDKIDILALFQPTKGRGGTAGKETLKLLDEAEKAEKSLH